MKFRTEYHASPSADFSLDYDKKILLLGSCFADNIGQRLIRTGWDTVINPCGVLYNPASIARDIQLSLNPDYEPELISHPQSGTFFDFDFSTKFSHPDAVQARRSMHEAMKNMCASLSEAQALCITFGTAWIYERSDNHQAVANCHKLPAATFIRRCISIHEAESIWLPLINTLHLLNPNLHIIFTVSPVRHLADGFEGNTRSKARLLLLCEQLSALPLCHYFPAYEILNDDLRDYRFYAEDLCHPSSMAADYIFSKFTETFIPPTLLPRMQAAEKEFRRSAHRPIIQNP